MPKYIITYLYFIAMSIFLVSCSPENAQPTSSVDNVEPKVDIIEEEEDVEELKNDELLETETVDQQSKALTKMVVHFIDVGHADATLLEFSDEMDTYTMLIDAGDWNANDVVSYLQAQKIAAIDIIAITHPHADHIGQLDKIINAVDVSEVWMNGETANSEVFARAISAIEDNGVDYYEPEVGEVFDIGPLEVTILHPKEPSGGTNDNSLAMRLKYGEVSFLFTGDGEEKAERELLDRGTNLKSDILHVGHHGSKTSTTESFFRAVDPDIAIYSAGVGNQYDHPDQEVIDRINANKTHLYGTDIHGTIRVETDGKTYTVQTNRDGTIPRTPKEDPESNVIEEPESDAISNESCIDINKAPLAEVRHIIHIGPERSQAVIEQRPFSSIDELSRIKGIGPARIKDIKEQGYACVGG